MKSYTQMTITLALVALGQLAVAGEPNDAALKKLDQNLVAAKSFQHGQDGASLMEIEQLVFYLPPDSKLRDAIEQKLIATLQAATTNDAKDFFCRQLRVVGTTKSIPCLEQLLADPQSAHMAVYALGSLEFPEACQALQRALAKTTGVVQADIINALAARRFAEAQPDFVKLLASADATVAQAAARALGKVGSADASQTLLAARATASPELLLAVDKALLECAERLAAAGSQEPAAAIYEVIRAQQKLPPFQRAALRGLVMTRPADAAKLLVQAIQQPNAALAGDAIAMINLVPGAEATKALAGLVKGLPPDTQVLLLRALGQRGDTAAATAIAESARSDNAAVRLAALEALGSAGDAAAAPILVDAATAGGDVTRVALRSLLRVPGTDVDRQLFELLAQGTEQARVAAIDALAGRSADKAVPPLLKAALAPQAAVRQAAYRALGTLTGPNDLVAMLDLAVASTSAEDRPLLVAAVAKLLSRCDDKDKALAAVLNALDHAPAAAQPVMLLILGQTAADKALPVLRAHLKDVATDNQDAVVAALSQWPDARVLDDLLRIIETPTTPARMEAALTGYIRLANTSKDPTELFSRVLQRVSRSSDKKLVLAGLDAQAESPGAIEMTLTYLNDKDLGPTAGLAAVHISNRLRGTHEDIARKALERVVKEVSKDDVRQRAQGVLNEMDKFKDHILTWMVAGPYSEKGKEGAAVYAMVFDPEKPDATNVTWVPLDKGIGSWDIDLEAMLGNHDHCAAYLRTRVWSPREQDAALEMGCDDAIKAWLNGQVVFDHWNEQAAAPRQHRAEVHLKEGWNDLMLKVVDASGGWVAACRVRDPNGLAIEGLKVEAK
jgi:HEAT repeat protein